MKLYIIKTDTFISPFQDHACESLIFNKPVKEHQKELAIKWNLDLVLVDLEQAIIDEECFLMADYVFCSRYLLKEFMTKAQADGKSSALALPRTVFTDMTTHIQDVKIGPDSITYDIFYHKGGSKTSLEDLRNYPSCQVEQKENVAEFPMPQGFTGENEVKLPFTAHRIWHIMHWNHIVNANGLSIIGLWKERWEYEKSYVIRSALWAAIKARSLNPHKVAMKLNIMGKNCHIHPTAVVEGCVLGDNVSIGALAVVKASVLGDRASVHDCASVEGSSVGENVLVGKNCVVFGCVLYPDSIATHRLMQGCMLGRQATTTGGGYLLDLNFEQEIKVQHKGKIVSVGSHFCGCCLGHRVRMGSGVWINHGREIPNGCTIIRDPKDVLSRIPKDLPEGSIHYIKESRLDEV